MALELAQQVVRELYAHKRLTMQTGLRLLNLEPSEKNQLLRYLPPLERLNLDDNYNWGILFAGVGFVTDFAALLFQYKCNDQSITAAINGDQAAVLDHILEGTRGIEGRWLKLTISRKSYQCVLVLLRRFPQHFDHLLYIAEQQHKAGMLRLLLQHFPPLAKLDLDERLAMTSLYKHQKLKIVHVLMEAGARVTNQALTSATACDNLELLQFYLQQGTDDIDQALNYALTNRSSKVAQWLASNTSATPRLFFDTGDELTLSRSADLLLILYPQCLEEFLLTATLKGDVRLVKQLLDRGASNKAQARQLLEATATKVIYRQAKLDLLAD